MRELLDDLIGLLDDGPVALALIVSTAGATPRALGSAMVVTAQGEVLGSLSGGCVDSAIVEVAEHVIATGTACSERFTSDDPEFGVGLICGGEIEVLVERLDDAHGSLLRSVVEHIDAHRPVALATVLGEQPEWQVVSESGSAPDSLVVRRQLDGDVAAMLAGGRSGVVGTDECEDPSTTRRPRTFVQSFAPPDRLIIAGANDFARALSVAAQPLGWRVTVVDARAVFTTTARFPAADEVIVDWPHRYLQNEIDSGATSSRTAVLVMTHDAKFDVPLLEVALEGAWQPDSTVGFVGALGSRRTQADRIERLRERGVTAEQLTRLRAPVGLDLGGHTPQETAVAILAELIAWRHGGSGVPLHATSGPIHSR